MKHILRLTTTLALVMGIAATSFAVVNPNTKLKSADTIEKQTTYRKLSKSSRRDAKKIGNKRRTSALRVRRLTERQRRDFYRRLIDIYIN